MSKTCSLLVLLYHKWPHLFEKISKRAKESFTTICPVVCQRGVGEQECASKAADGPFSSPVGCGVDATVHFHSTRCMLHTLGCLAQVNSRLLQDKFDKLMSKEVDGFVHLTDANFRKAILDGPRNYGAVVLFTVDSPQYPCPACAQAVDYVRSARFSVEMAAARNLTGSSHDKIVWATCNFIKCNSVFATFGMRNAPSIAYFAPTKDRSKWAQSTASLPEGSSLHPHDSHSAQQVLDIMHLPASVKLVRPAEEHRGFSVLAACAVALFALWVGGDVGKLALWRSPSAWRALSMLTFGLAVSGLVFCIIRSPPMLGVDSKGKPQLFSSGGREQNVAEGLWVGLLTLTAAGMVIALVSVAKMGRGDLTNLAVGVPLCLASAALLFRLLQLYQFKTSWYDPVSSLPLDWQRALAQLVAWLKQPSITQQQVKGWVSWAVKTAASMPERMAKLLQ